MYINAGLKGVFMDNVLVSVVIPVYNVEKYLVYCLESIKNQTYTNIEIICINDGSTDNSLNILNEYSKKDSRIKVLSQPNQGQSIARNEAINITNGKYIYFLDSDDMIELNTLEITVKHLEERQLDILFFDGCAIFENNELEECYSKYKTMYKKNINCEKTLTGFDMFAKLVSSNNYIASQCLYIFDKKLIVENDIRFKENSIHEDNLFTFKLLLSASKVAYINETLFIRRVREGSTMTKVKTFDNFLGYLVCIMEMTDFLESLNIKDNKTLIEYLDKFIQNTINLYGKLPLVEQVKIETLDIQKKYFFELFLKPRLTCKEIQKCYKQEINSLNGQLEWHKNKIQEMKSDF